MSGVYSVEDLLKLRASPLVCKPSSLPPIEEWMGTQDLVAKRPATRGRQDDSNLQTEGFQKRPTLDPSMRKSTTDPERIVLGPPRRSFASSNAARNLGKAGTIESEDGAKESVGRHERTKTGEDLENKFGDRRSGHFGGANGRHSARHDQEQDRTRRRYDGEEGEGRAKKDHDRARWGRDDKVIEETDESSNAKAGLRHETQARSRFEQSWLRSDRGTEEARRDNERSGWRRDRGKDGDWDTPMRGDVDPEWMDEPDAGEPMQAHTQEDFQRWKERMKASANGSMGEKQNPASATNTSTQDSSAFMAGVVSPDLNVNSMDKFFAKLNEKKTPAEDKSVTTKPASKSKFASLFSPVSESKPVLSPDPVPSQPLPPPPPPPPQPPSVVSQMPSMRSPLPAMDQGIASVEADQAGFKRILEMLGKRDATPTMEPTLKKANLPGLEHQAQEKSSSPDLMALFKQTQPSRQTPVSHGPPGLERLIESRSPVEGHRRQQTPNKDELLLNLLRQADISAKQPAQSHREYGEQRPPSDLFASMNNTSRNEPRQMVEERSDMDRQIPMQQRADSRSIFDDPAISGLSYQDEMGARQGIPRRPTSGYEDPYFDRLRQPEQKPMQPPPGMPRPPGLDQMSRVPPGWPGPPPPQHQQPRPGPPPGINMPRGMQPPYGVPQPGPMPSLPQQGQRPPQRKYTGDAPIPNFPPGIGPPPGFMSQGPPPGFHHNSNTGQNYGRYGMGGEAQAPQQQGPSNMGRAFMEMYGNVERGGIRGGNGGVPLPPGFR